LIQTQLTELAAGFLRFLFFDRDSQYLFRSGAIPDQQPDQTGSRRHRPDKSLLLRKVTRALCGRSPTIFRLFSIFRAID
jgi:hypothetical protein